MKQRTRIVCTLGPASDTDASVRAMIRAGMDVARLNFSHGDHPMHAARIERVRRIAREENAVVALLGDLQGPKIRVGDIAGGSIELSAGATFTLTTRAVDGDANAASVDWADLPQAVKPGQRILLDDGLIELQVGSVSGADVVTRVVTGGTLKPHKGVNLPGVRLNISALTDKDRADLVFAAEQDLDYLALSFVRHPEDVMELKRLLAARGAMIPVIAKIEKPEAIDAIDAILDVSDGVMVARGDLGVEAPPERVPLFQKMIIRKANAIGKPVITATQMLESMINNPRPTRAEASDVANAILDGTDAVMLSAETAIGKFPVEAVETMERIADAAGASALVRSYASSVGADRSSIPDAMGKAACEIARQLNARVIITATSSGFTARMIARHRPATPIFAVTSLERTRRRLALVWGIQSALVEQTGSTDAMIAASLAAALKQGMVDVGDLAVITAGVPAGISGTTNMIQVRVVEQMQ
ncbi:MAG: pyruvate kinase [Chloroflexota bacterium]|nr:pyruvate kinase [Chloroflexota bacterium]